MRDASNARNTYSARMRALLAINWLVLVVAVTLLSALSSILAPNVWNVISSNLAAYDAVERTGLWINLILYTLPVVISAVVAYCWPRRWRGTLLAITLLPLLIGAMTSGRITALLVIITILLPMVWGGREIVHQFVPDADRAALWALGATIGLIFLGLLGFIAGIFGVLRPLFFWPILVGSTVALIVSPARKHLLDDLKAIRPALMRPITLTPIRILMAGLLVSTAWSMILGALSPEINSDTTRQRTVAALNFAQSRHLDVGDVAGGVAAAPALGEITYAIILALGPLSTAKLLALMVGGLCVISVALVARRLGGRRTELLAAVSFATMPLVVWLGQTAYLDLFTCLAALAAILFLLTRRIPTINMAFASGLCCGWGIAIKVHFGYVAAGVAVTLLLLVFTSPGTALARMKRASILLVTFGVGAMAVLIGPLIRSTLLTGQIPGLTLATQSFVRTDSTSTAALADLPRFGFGRDLFHLILLPLDLTINSLQFEWTPTPWGPFNGLLGYLPLALLPLLVLLRPERRTMALWLGAAVAGLGWFFSAQYLRYGLPIVALLCPLGAVAFEQLRRKHLTPKLRQVTMLLVLIPLLAAVVVQARVPEYKHDFVLGRQSETSYVNKFLVCCGGTAVLRLLDAQPGATRALALNEIPRIYTRTPVGTALLAPDGQALRDTGDPLATLAALDASGYSHLIITRRYLSTGWEHSQLADETFLRRYTVLVGNSSDTYLYRILPPAERTAPESWTQGAELLTNGGFETTTVSDVPVAWAAIHMDGGRDNTVSAGPALPRYEHDGNVASGQGAILVGRTDGWETTVAIRSGQRYLLDAASRSAATVGANSGGFTLQIEWRDANNRLLSTSVTRVPTTETDYHHFSLAATAPSGAMTATVVLLASDKEVWVDDVSLQEAIGGVDLETMP